MKLNLATVLQLAGTVSMTTGVILSLHHVPAAVALIGGLAAFGIGKKLAGG